MDEPRRTSRRIRREMRSPGLSLNLAADVHIVSSTTSGSGAASASTSQHVHVRQGRSARTAPPPEQKDPS